LRYYGSEILLLLLLLLLARYDDQKSPARSGERADEEKSRMGGIDDGWRSERVRGFRCFQAV